MIFRSFIGKMAASVSLKTNSDQSTPIDAFVLICVAIGLFVGTAMTADSSIMQQALGLTVVLVSLAAGSVSGFVGKREPAQVYPPLERWIVDRHNSQQALGASLAAQQLQAQTPLVSSEKPCPRL